MLLTNVRIVDWENDFLGAVRIVNGKIDAVGEHLEEKDHVMDGGGLTLMPAFVDLHAHFRYPGFPKKETIASGSRAAVKGGYTLVSLMPNTNPPITTMEQIEDVKEQASKVGLIEVNQVATITDGMKGQSLAHLDALDPKEVPWISDDGVGVMNAAIMLQALQKAKERGLGLMCHEEEIGLVGLDTALAEELMTYRDVEMARRVGTKLHVCHVSTKRAMRFIEAAKAAPGGGVITCEVAPHHLYWNDSVSYRVNPPLRPEKDRQYMIEAIVKGAVDAIATDHAPHTEEDKAGGANGISGIEFAFAVCNTVLVETGQISLSYLSRLMSKTPAILLGQKKGRIAVGYDADLVLLDPKQKFVASDQNMVSRGKNTPIGGDCLSGVIFKTFHKGELVYENRNGAHC